MKNVLGNLMMWAGRHTTMVTCLWAIVTTIAMQDYDKTWPFLVVGPFLLAANVLLMEAWYQKGRLDEGDEWTRVQEPAQS